MSKKPIPSSPTVAVVGATGMVGGVLLNAFQERQFPIGELRLLASKRSVGSAMQFRGESIPLVEATADAFQGVDLVFFAATGGLSKELAPAAVEAGAVVIDKSSTWRMDPTVPLVVPEVNADALAEQRGIVSCPNCTTIGLVMALEPIRRAVGLRRVVVTTLQAVSGAGRPGLDELVRSEEQPDSDHCEVFAAPIGRNTVPLCESVGEDGSTSEELKLLHETRKILSLPELSVAMTCVRVPVPVGHGAAVLVETESDLGPEEATRLFDRFPGVRVVDAPTQRDVAGTDEVLVGRVRREPAGSGLLFWQVSDNLRKGAATNAVQIAEALLG